MGENFYQKLVNEAYDIWSKNKDWSYEEFVDSLDEKHKAAVLVATFDSQVDEGGFYLWDENENEYFKKVDDLLAVLEEFVKDTESEVGIEVLNLIDTYVEELHPILVDLIYGDVGTDEDNEHYEEAEYQSTRQYLKINKRFLEEFNDWLIKKYGE